jgi:hypothetical protein
MSWRDARRWAHSQGIKSNSQWRKLKKPKDIPANPDTIYRHRGWTCWGDFLGSEFVHIKYRSYLPYEKLQRRVRALGFSTSTEYKGHSKNNHKVFPLHPDYVYKHSGFEGWEAFLGNSWPVFAKTKSKARQLNILNSEDYKRRMPKKFPRCPHEVYKREWPGWFKFLGTKTRQWKMPFANARTIVRKLGFSNRSEYVLAYRNGKLPAGLPYSPSTSYNGQYIGMNDFFGCDNRWVRYEEAKKVVQALEIKSMSDHLRACRTGKLPKNIPCHPWRKYQGSGWVNAGEFFGTKTKAPNGYKFVSYTEAKKLLAPMKLTNSRAFVTCLRPDGVPSIPDVKYKNEWRGWGDFLSSTVVNCVSPLGYEALKKEVRSAGVKCQKDYHKFRKQNRLRFPSNPDLRYKEWTSWGDFLGKLNNKVLSADFLPVGIVPSAVALRIIHLGGKTSDQSLSESLTQLREAHKNNFALKEPSVSDVVLHMEEFPRAMEQMKHRLPAQEHAHLLRYCRNYYLGEMHTNRVLRAGVLKAKGAFAAGLRQAHRREGRKLRLLQREVYRNGERVNFMQALSQVNAERQS